MASIFQRFKDLYNNLRQNTIPQGLARIASSPGLNRAAQGFQSKAQSAVNYLQQAPQARIGQALQRVPDVPKFGSLSQPSKLTMLAPGLTYGPELIRSYGRTLERAWRPKETISQYKAHPFQTGLEDVGNIADITPLGAGLAIGARALGFGKAPAKFIGKFDKLPRAEISDLASRVKTSNLSKLLSQGTARLGEILDHAGLYKNYPQLKQLRVEFKAGGTVQGAFNPQTFSISLSPGLSRQQMRSTILHEVQHVIQEIEGFAKGGTIGTAAKVLETKRKSDLKELGKQIEIATKNKNWTLARELNRRWAEVFGGKNYGLSLNPDDMFKDYRNLAGEIESRAVQAREGYTAAQRKATPFFEDIIKRENINPKDVITRFDSGVSQLKKAAQGGGVKLSTGAEVPPIKQLTDQQLWDLKLTPIEKRMPQDLQDYIVQAGKEFDSRKIKLTSGLSAKPSVSQGGLYDVKRKTEFFSPSISQKGGRSNLESPLKSSITQQQSIKDINFQLEGLRKQYPKLTGNAKKIVGEDIAKLEKQLVAQQPGGMYDVPIEKSPAMKGVDFVNAEKSLKRFKTDEPIGDFTGYITTDGTKVKVLQQEKAHKEIFKESGIPGFFEDIYNRYGGIRVAQSANDTNIQIGRTPTSNQIVELSKIPNNKPVRFDFYRNGSLEKSSPLEGVTKDEFIRQAKEFYNVAQQPLSDLPSIGQKKVAAKVKIPVKDVVIEEAGPVMQTPSKTKGPIEVIQDAQTGKYHLFDGQHRLKEAIARGDTTIDALVASGEPVKGGGWNVNPYTPQQPLGDVSKLPGGVGTIQPQPLSVTNLGRTPLQPEVKANIKIPQQEKLKVQQQGAGGGGNIPSQPSIDPIKKITQLLKEAKPMEAQQAALYSAERARRVGAVAGVGRSVPGEAGYFAQLSKLKGELPKVQFERIRQGLTQPDIDSLFNTVEKAAITPFEKVTAKTGLAKLLGAEGGQIPVQSEMRLLNEIFPAEFIQAIQSKRPFMQRLWAGIQGALNLPRAVMSTADLSAPLRQGIFLIGRPKQWIPAFKSMFKYAFNEKSYLNLMDDIKARPNYMKMREGKLALTDMSSELLNREEAFMSNLAERIPLFGRVARGSNRAYSGFLNKLRADVFDDLVGSAQKQGIKIEGKTLTDLTSFINAATGRGNLPKVLQNTAPILNATFFSPRLIASRLNLLSPVTYIKYDPFVRKEAIKSLLGFGGTALTVLGLAKLAGADVEDDPRNADFGKIKVGNTRYDVLGGFQQYIRLASQLLTGKVISSTTGKTITLGEGYKPLTRKDILLRFFEAKEAPVASFITALITGKTGIGEPVNIPAEILNRFMPMFLQDIYDIAKDKDSIGQGLLMALPGMFGVGSQTYGKSEYVEGVNPIGQETSQIRPVQGFAESVTEKVFGQRPLGSTASFNAETYYKQLKAMPPEEANAIVKRIKSTNKDLYDKLLQVAKDTKRGVTIEEKTLKGKGVASGDRALSVAKEINKLKTPEEKNALVKRYIELGIITDEVKKQLILLKKQGKL